VKVPFLHVARPLCRLLLMNEDAHRKHHMSQSIIHYPLFHIPIITYRADSGFA
jgi:hypothetical protein